MGTKKVNRSDETLLSEIWEAVWREDVIRSIDIHDISIAVQDGQVFLSGHVSKDSNQRLVEGIARSVPGVSTVYNHLVADHDLTIQVAQALSGDERTHSLNLSINSYHGWIGVGGEVPDRELQQAVQAAAGRVPTVRGVISLPRVTGESDTSELRAVQPQIGVSVCGKDGIEGSITQVIIHPHHRLVTHAVVRTSDIVDGMNLSRDFLVPVEAMDVVNEGGVVLKRDAPGVKDFPVFHPAEFPFPPATWQPPYPYRAGSVRWPRTNHQPVKEFLRSQAREISLSQELVNRKDISSDQQPETNEIERVSRFLPESQSFFGKEHLK